jgi:hypothetical protein
MIAACARASLLGLVPIRKTGLMKSILRSS